MRTRWHHLHCPQPASRRSSPTSIPSSSTSVTWSAPSMDGSPRDPGGVRGHDEGLHPLGGAGRHRQLGDPVGVEHERRGAVQLPAAGGAARLDRGRVRVPASVRPGQRERPRLTLARHRAEEAAALLGVTAGGHDGHELRGGREERRGVADVAELLHDDRQLDRGGPAAPVLGRDGETGPVQAAQGLPQVRRVVVVVDDGAEVGRRALLGQHGRGRLLEAQLVLVELEVHLPPPRRTTLSDHASYPLATCRH